MNDIHVIHTEGQIVKNFAMTKMQQGWPPKLFIGRADAVAYAIANGYAEYEVSSLDHLLLEQCGNYGLGSGTRNPASKKRVKKSNTKKS